MEFFTEDDFSIVNGPINRELAVDIANEKLAKALGAVVYFQKEDGLVYNLGDTKMTFDTHQARLFNIQPIEKKCDHKKIGTYMWSDHFEATCADCGKKLVARWEEA